MAINPNGTNAIAAERPQGISTTTVAGRWVSAANRHHISQSADRLGGGQGKQCLPVMGFKIGPAAGCEMWLVWMMDLAMTMDLDTTPHV